VPGNEVRPSDLSTLEREPLHDALAIVKRFRASCASTSGSDAL
jgi:signal-transduction protein with cAMP-binding, CBS, and nucleotidyltransferase domain